MQRTTPGPRRASSLRASADVIRRSARAAGTSSTGHVDGLSTMLWISVPSACPHWRDTRWSLRRQRDRWHTSCQATLLPRTSANRAMAGFPPSWRLTRPGRSPSRRTVHTGCGWPDDKHVDKPHGGRRSGLRSARSFFRHERPSAHGFRLTCARIRASTMCGCGLQRSSPRRPSRGRLTVPAPAASPRVIHRGCG